MTHRAPNIPRQWSDPSHTGVHWNTDGLYTTDAWSDQPEVASTPVNNGLPASTGTGVPIATNTLTSSPNAIATDSSIPSTPVSLPPPSNSIDVQSPTMTGSPSQSTNTLTPTSSGSSNPTSSSIISSDFSSITSSPGTSSSNTRDASTGSVLTVQSVGASPSGGLKKSNTGLIAGLVVGLLVALVLVVLGVIFLIRRRRARQVGSSTDEKSRDRGLPGMDDTPLLGGNPSGTDVNPFSDDSTWNPGYTDRAPEPIMTGLAAEYYNEDRRGTSPNPASPTPSLMNVNLPRHRMQLPKPDMETLSERHESGISFQGGYASWLKEPVQQLFADSARAGSPVSSNGLSSPSSAGPLTQAFRGGSDQESQRGSVFSLDGVLGRNGSAISSLNSGELRPSHASLMPEFEQVAPQYTVARHASITVHSSFPGSQHSASSLATLSHRTHSLPAPTTSGGSKNPTLFSIASSGATLGSHGDTAENAPVYPTQTIQGADGTLSVQPPGLRLDTNRNSQTSLATTEPSPAEIMQAKLLHRTSANAVQLPMLTPDSATSFSPGFTSPGEDTITDGELSSRTYATESVWDSPISPPPIPSVAPLNLRRNPSGSDSTYTLDTTSPAV